MYAPQDIIVVHINGNKSGVISHMVVPPDGIVLDIKGPAWNKSCVITHLVLPPDRIVVDVKGPQGNTSCVLFHMVGQADELRLT